MGQDRRVDDALTKKLKTYRISYDEHKRIAGLLGREPHGVEWALFSAMWSEHCSYKSSRVHLKKLFNKSPRVLQSFGENAGVVDLGEGERVAFKMESHNHPSYIEPYQGATTGVGGILRDIFTMGARPVAVADYLCFGRPQAERMESIVDGVVRGIAGYGNPVGVPTITGQTEFDESYDGNILVNAMAVGLFRPGEKVFLSQAKGAGNLVVYAGAKTGRDGVHGASMASESFDEDSESKRPTIQIGDPFFEKLLIEACLEVMKEDLVVAIQDMGAAGITSSSFEMASKGGVGLEIHLDQVPLRDPTLTPEDILLSESQERMLMVVEPSKLKQVEAIFSRWGLEAVSIGTIVDKKTVTLFWHGKKLTEIDPELLTEHAPVYERAFEKWNPQNRVEEVWALRSFEKEEKLENFLLKSLSSPEGTSREFIYRQYDGHVGAQTVLDSRSPVGVLFLRDSQRALGVVTGCRPKMMRLDARDGGADAVFYPALELSMKGFEPLAVTDCLNFGNPENVSVMTSFVASLEGINKACEAIQAPIISGNVSFYNETQTMNITPTPSIGLVGLRPSVEGIPHSDFVDSGENIYLLRIKNMTGSQMGDAYGSLSSEKSLGQVKAMCRLLQSMTSGKDRMVQTSRISGKFGLGYTLARMCLPKSAHASDQDHRDRSRGGVGAEFHTSLFEALKWDQSDKRGDLELLASENCYDVVLTSKQDETVFKKFVHSCLDKNSNLDFELSFIGKTGAVVNGEPVLRFHQENSSIEISIKKLSDAYHSGWTQAFPQHEGRLS